MKGQHFNHFFPSVLGHELGNVLNGLLGMAEVLGETPLTAEQSRWLDAIIQSGLQMQALVEAAGSAPGQPFHTPEPRFERVDGVRLMEQVITSHIPAARLNNNCLYLSISADLARFWNCDPRMVRQLLDNVLGNAIKFTRHGDIHVDLCKKPVTGTVLFRIRDSGIGFGAPGHCASRVAEAGGLASAGMNTGNRGLGLPVCRQIIRALNGELHIGRRDGVGTQIEIALPGVLDESADQPSLECSLFRLVQCRLNLSGSILPVVQSALARLQVAETTGEPDTSGDILQVELSEQSSGLSRTDRRLLLKPGNAGGRGPGCRSLTLPLLESPLASLLLEMVLDWQTARVRNGNPGFFPSRR